MSGDFLALLEQKPFAGISANRAGPFSLEATTLPEEFRMNRS